MEYVTGVPVSGVLRDIRRQNAEQMERGVSLVEGSASDDSLQQHQEQEHQQGRHNKMTSETQQGGQETTENPLAQPPQEQEHGERQDVEDAQETCEEHPKNDQQNNKEDEQKRILDGELLPLKNRVADAICFLLSLPKPPDTRPGPAGGGRIKHWTFGRDESDAPHEFSDVEHLETYVNEKISETFPDLPHARFVHEGLRLCYCDLNFDNFLLEDAEDPSGRIIIIDFEHASWLPYSFLTWEAWDKREFAMEERIRSRCGLELNRDNVYALYALLRQREWNSAIRNSPSPSGAAI
ncbi:hypothetical protein CH63R_12387 [Colletotrichum higginsianum IMI 349063]|uniref:Aminoglycoside phosphotransferase domain-containing protein n=4 Tax=Colletotrichum higginsianum TaxID=80884 RepID=A0A1B7XU35_COLHI|nr:hypothetical protein CH63R_12387 [Colletotrichum higginsianum IMI 349063]OBR03260.1 hypothetical protein CH63R_12387 [Colletotrichum higginsianum IMI 349063]TIC89918.1 hypothetical protein CH35J_012359 [Colletotrichum higginsianum]